MTDDELQAMWVAGASLTEMSAATGRNKVNLQSHIRRLRRREGEQRWPKRVSAIDTNPPPKPQAKRVGSSTLPPLASLSDG